MILRAIAVLAALAVGTAASALPGDVYVDCEVDVADAVLLERALAGEIVLTDEQRASADLPPIGSSDADGVVDVADLVTLKRIIAREADPASPGLTPRPTLDAIPAGNPVVISGNAPSGSTVHVYVNGRKHPHTVFATGGVFNFGSSNVLARVPLVDGDNRITVVASNGSGTLRSCSSDAQVTTYSAATASFTPTASNPEIGDQVTNPPEGHIDTTEVWTPALTNGQPIVAHEDIVVKSGAALFVLPGTRIRFDAGKVLKVENGGTLQILGTAENRPLLDGSSATAGSCGSTWGGIVVESRSTGLPVTTIEKAKIDCALTGLGIGNGPNSGAVAVLRGSEITRWQNQGVFVHSSAARAWIENNRITDSLSSISTAISSNARGNSDDLASSNTIRINRNVISANHGISLGARPDEVRGNTITGSNPATNGRGLQIHASSDPSDWAATPPATDPTLTIENNTVTGFCVGVANTVSPDVALLRNNIYGNDKCTCSPSDPENFCANYTTTAVTTGYCPPTALAATENWWGSTTFTEIESKLHACGTPSTLIDFVEYLDAPFDEGGTAIGGDDLLQGTIANGMPLPPGDVWTVVGTVTIPGGVSFSIPDGKTLRFIDDGELVVSGELVVENSSAADVVFTSLPSQGASAAPGDWSGIVVQGSGKATIADAVIEYATTAIKATGASAEVTLTGSLVKNFSQVGVVIENGAKADILNNRDGGGALGIVAPPGRDAIRVKNVTTPGRAVIDDNEIKGGLSGVSIDGSSPWLRGNLIHGNNIGVYITGLSNPLISKQTSPAIPGNEIKLNCRGIYIDAASAQPAPIVTYNQIHSNGCPNVGDYNYYVHAYGSGAAADLVADHNWWGSATTSAIATSIFDRSDPTAKLGVPIVNFLPFCTNASAACPESGGGYLLGTQTSSTLAAGSYQVVGALIVPNGVTWQIGAGATLNFGAAQPLLVEGHLEIAGTSGSKVTLQGPSGGQWGGIAASGSGASIDIQHATLEGASTLIRAEETGSQPISIADSTLGNFSFGIYLRDVTPSGGAEILRNIIDNGSSSGTGITLLDSDATIEGNQIHDLAVGISVLGDSNATIGGAGSAANTIEDFNREGVLFSGAGAQGSIFGNAIANSNQRGEGIELIDSSPTISENAISGTYFGIHVFAASDPMIGEGNVITGNVWGILLRGNRYPNPPPNPPGYLNPQPTITRNDLTNVCATSPSCVGRSPLEQMDLCPATGGNLCVTGYQFDADLALDARENYWGTVTESTIRDQKIYVEGGNPIPVDFSQYLDAAGGDPVFATGSTLSSIFKAVSVEHPIIRPTLGPDTSTTISFKLAAPATNVVVRIYEEPASGALVKTLETVPSLSAGVLHTTPPWDGRDSSTPDPLLVPDDAYRFEIEATQGGITHLYALERDGRIVGSAAEVSGNWNAHRNEYKKAVIYNNFGPPMRGRMAIDSGPGITGAGPDLLVRALAAGQRRLFVFDGRNHLGTILESPSSSTSDRYVIGFHGHSKVTRNAIFVQDTAPSIAGASYVFVAPPAAPSISNVEVLSDPYLVDPTYDQISTIRFKLDQPGNVSVKILKPGVPDASNPANVVATLTVQGTGLDKSAVWDGYGSNPAVHATSSGSYTFFIEAQHPTQSNLKSTYRGTIQVRLAPGL